MLQNDSFIFHVVNFRYGYLRTNAVGLCYRTKAKHFIFDPISRKAMTNEVDRRMNGLTFLKVQSSESPVPPVPVPPPFLLSQLNLIFAVAAPTRLVLLSVLETWLW